MSESEPTGRYLRREYMSDREFMTRFTAAERECYILMALFSDDAGFMINDPATLAAGMYRYEYPETREAFVLQCIERFKETGRYEVLECGIHVFLPKVAGYPRGRARRYDVRSRHEYRCVRKLHQADALQVHSGCTEDALQPYLTVHNLTEPNRAPERAREADPPSADAPVGLAPMADLLGEWFHKGKH